MKPGPVTITKPDGSSHVTSAYDLKHRPPSAADVPSEASEDREPLAPQGAVTIELVEEMVMRTLVKVMRDSDKLSERTAAATSAIKYLGIKYRVGPEFGADLDE